MCPCREKGAHMMNYKRNKKYTQPRRFSLTQPNKYTIKQHGSHTDKEENSRSKGSYEKSWNHTEDFIINLLCCHFFHLSKVFVVTTMSYECCLKNNLVYTQCLKVYVACYTTGIKFIAK